MPSHKRADLLVAMPSIDGKVPYDTRRSLERMTIFAQSKGYILFNTMQVGSNLPRNRHLMVKTAQRLGVKHILFIDSDMVFHEDAATNLLDCRKDIVSGLYFGKQPPFSAIAYRKDKKGELQPFDNLTGMALFDDLEEVGAGMLLVRMSVFDTIQAPWFNFRWIPEKDDWGGEDGYFCRKAKQNGYKIHLDTRVGCGHIGSYIYTENDYIGYQLLKQKAEEEEALKKEQDAKPKADLVLPKG